MYWKRLFIAGVLAVFIALTGGTAVQAATIDDFVTGNAVYAPDSDNAVFVIANKLDFGDIDDYTNGGVTSADVVQMLDIPAGMIVNAMGLRVNTAAGSGVTGVSVNIGDGSDTNGWITAWDLGASASGVSSTYEEGVAGEYHTLYGGNYYSSADTIDLVVPTLSGEWMNDDPVSACTEMVLEVWAEGVMAPTKKNYNQ